jgi:hypothetical protein
MRWCHDSYNVFGNMGSARSENQVRIAQILNDPRRDRKVVAEWLIAPVLKTGDSAGWEGKRPFGGSNNTL